MTGRGMSQAVEILKICALHVMQALGKDHSEAIYQRALVTALNSRGVCHRLEVPCPIMYLGECIGNGRADLVIDDLVVEIKANQKLPSAHLGQVAKYVQSLSEIEKRQFRGLVVNFNQASGSVEFVHHPEEKTKRKSSAFQRSLLHEAKPPAYVTRMRTKMQRTREDAEIES